MKSRLSFSLAVWSGQCLLGAQSQHHLPPRVVENSKDDANEVPQAGTGPGGSVMPPMGIYATHACDIGTPLASRAQCFAKHLDVCRVILRTTQRSGPSPFSR